jgi:hypothetical protein
VPKPTPAPAIDTAPPSAPTLVNAAYVAPTQVGLTWQAAQDNIGVVAYQIVRNNRVVTTIGNVTEYVDRTVKQRTKYSYRIRAIDAMGNISAASQTLTIVTPRISRWDWKYREPQPILPPIQIQPIAPIMPLEPTTPANPILPIMPDTQVAPVETPKTNTSLRTKPKNKSSVSASRVKNLPNID